MDLLTNRDPFTVYKDEPYIINGVHHPYTAFNQGFNAAMIYNSSLYENPYNIKTREHHWWKLGWKCYHENE